MATIITKNSSTASAVPAAGDLVKGELAVNVTDKKVYTKDNSAAVVKLVGSLGNQEASAVAITGGTINGTTIGATTTATGAFTTVSASGGFTGNLTGNVTGNVSGTAANVTGVVAIANGGTGLSALGTGVQSALGQNVTGSGSFVLSTSPSLTTPNLGTPSAAVLTNATGLPLTTGVTGTLGVANGGTGITAFGTGVATALGQNVTGSGGIVLATSPSLTTPNLGTPSAATLTNATGLPISTGVSGLGTGVATALAVNTGSSGAFVVNGGALGTPSSGTVTNLTGTASININGTVGATTPNTGAFTTTTISTSETLSYGTANGVAYLNGSKVLTTGSALTFDGTNFGVGTASEPFSRGYGRWLALSSVSSAAIEINAATGNTATIDLGVNGTRYAYFNATASDSFLSTAAANPLLFGINNSEQMRLTSTGLGIGTSSPAYKLDVNGSIRSVNNALFGTNGTSTATVTVGGSPTGNYSSAIILNGTNAAKGWVVGQNQNVFGALEFIQTTANGGNTIGGTASMLLDSSGNLGLGVTPSAWNVGSAIDISSRGSISDSSAVGTSVGRNAYYNAGWKYKLTSASQLYLMDDGGHKFFTAPSGTAGTAISFTQAMTLTQGGNLLIGATSAGVTNTKSIIADLGADGYLVVNHSGAASGSGFQYFGYNGAIIGSITQNGTAGVLYNITSDYRLKNVVGAVTGAGERIDALLPVDYTWKADGAAARGFLAHEFQAVYPNSVTGTKDAVDAEGKPVYQQMQASTTEVIADLVAEIQSLRARVAQLEAK